MLRIASVTLLLTVIALVPLRGQVREWTSSSGSKINASYEATINGVHWLLEPGGRLMKVAPDQLSGGDLAFIQGSARSDSPPLTMLRPPLNYSTQDASELELLEILAGT